MNPTIKQALVDHCKRNWPDREVKFLEVDDRDNRDYSQPPKEEIEFLLPSEICDGKAVGILDIHYGYLALWNGTNWEVTTSGIFQEEYLYLADSYGFPDGAIFKNTHAK